MASCLRRLDRTKDVDPTYTAYELTLIGLLLFRAEIKQERPAVADKPARRLRNDCTVYVKAVGLQAVCGVVARPRPFATGLGTSFGEVKNVCFK